MSQFPILIQRILITRWAFLFFKCENSCKNNKIIKSDIEKRRTGRYGQKLTRGHLSMNSGITESRRNASLYPEKSEQGNEGFAENYKQKYESLKKIADEQFKNIVIY